jgi:peptide/nickel transport system permease protein
MKKIGSTALTIFLILSFNFYLFRVLPGNPFKMLFRGVTFSAAQMDFLRAEFGLDQPLWVQYVLYLENTAKGNLGLSYETRAPVIDLVGPALVNTVILLMAATFLSIILGIAIGMVAAWWRGSKTEVVMSATTLVLYCMPTFWLGLMLMVLGVLYFHLPVAGMSTPGLTGDVFAQIGDVGQHMVLPLATLVLGLTGQYVLVMKGALLDVLTEDYMVTATAKGISTRKIMWEHGFRNAVLPMVTLVALNIGLSFAGAIQTETIFSWPGIGLLIYRSILARDYPILLANLAADLILPLLDPRVSS